MEYLLGCLFNAIWLAGAFLLFALLSWLFSFVSLPAWLKLGIVTASSINGSLICMGLFAKRFVLGLSWEQTYREDDLKSMIVIWAITAGACLGAVFIYMLHVRLKMSDEARSWLTGGGAAGLWFLLMHFATRRVEKGNIGE